MRLQLQQPLQATFGKLCTHVQDVPAPSEVHSRRVRLLSVHTNASAVALTSLHNCSNYQEQQQQHHQKVANCAEEPVLAALPSVINATACNSGSGKKSKDSGRSGSGRGGSKRRPSACMRQAPLWVPRTRSCGCSVCIAAGAHPSVCATWSS